MVNEVFVKFVCVFTCYQSVLAVFHQLMGGGRHQLYRPGKHWAIYWSRWGRGGGWDSQNVAIAADVTHTTASSVDAVDGFT